MEGDAGPGRLNPTDSQDTADDASAAPAVTPLDADADYPVDAEEQPTDGRRAERFGRAWVASIAVVLILVAGAVAAGGVVALRAHQKSEDYARADAAAVAAAKDCVTATQAPDTAVMSASQAKIIECSTGDFGTQAMLYSGVLADAYQAANVKVQVTEMRAAVEKHGDGGTVDVLVAMRIKVSNLQVADQEQGYRLRVQMAPEDGTYKIAKLDQVAS